MGLEEGKGRSSVLPAEGGRVPGRAAGLAGEAEEIVGARGEVVDTRGTKNDHPGTPGPFLPARKKARMGVQDPDARGTDPAGLKEDRQMRSMDPPSHDEPVEHGIRRSKGWRRAPWRE